MKSISLGSAAALALSLSLSAQSGTVATAYEQLLAGANDLSGQSFTFTPNGLGGYDITAAGAFDNSFSNAVAFGDDNLQNGFPLGFTINMPGAGAVSAMQISSNGWVAPDGLFTSSDFSESTTEMDGQGTRIAMLWDDLSPNNAGAVYVDNLPGLWLVTFDQVPQFSNTGANTFQVQIRADGSFTLAYGTVEADCIAGFSYGNGRPASTIDLTVDLPYQTIGNFASFTPFGNGCPDGFLTFFEDIDAGNIDLAGLAFTMTPNGSNGYDVTPTGSFNPNFSNNLLLGDDQLVDALALGFTINVPGAGAVSAIDVSSNGWVAPDNANTSSQAFESDSLFITSFARWAVMWDDLNPGAGGGVYFDTAPGMAMVTYDQISQFSGGNGPTTAQIQIYADGSVTMVYDATVIDSNLDGIFGFSAGNSAVSRLVDLTADLPLSTSDAVPASHTLSATPAIGTTVDFQLNDLSGSAIAAAIFIGVTQLSVDLTPAGAPGCFQLTETYLFLDCPAPVAGSTALSLAIPANSSLVGASFVTQGAVVDPSANSLQVVTSNAVQVNVGN